MSNRPKVWVTRAEPGASVTADRLRGAGFDPLVAPLLTVREIEADLDLTGVAALAFTSTNAVRIFAAREGRRDLPVFAVGDATANAASRAGFVAVRSAGGDVGDLCRLIAKAQPSGPILAPGGVERAGDLVASLKRLGLVGRAVAIYNTPAVEALSAEATRALQMRALAAVLLHSPRAAAVLAAMAAPFDVSEMRAVGLSSACLRPAHALGFAAVVHARRPREDAMLDALFAALGNPASRG